MLQICPVRGGTLCRGIGGTLSRGIAGTLCRGITGTLCCGIGGTLYRIILNERLTEIFYTMPSPHADLVKARNYAMFSYKESLKSENNFRNIVRNEIVGKTRDAIKRAKELEAHFASSDIPNHDKAPCTLVHHLVEELIRLGGKEI